MGNKPVSSLPLHGFSSVRQVHLNAVLVLVRLEAHPLKHPRFPEVSINCANTSRQGGIISTAHGTVTTLLMQTHKTASVSLSRWDSWQPETTQTHAKVLPSWESCS